MEARRDEGFRRAREAVDSERYRRLVLQRGAMAGQRQPGGPRPIPCGAPRERPVTRLRRRSPHTRLAKIVKKLGRLKKLDMRRRHKLRIRIKKLRYATEFFASLFGSSKSRRKKLADILEVLQEPSAGSTISACTASSRARSSSGQRKIAASPERAFAMGIVTGREQPKFEALYLPPR